MGCMREKHSEGKCPYCGFDETDYKQKSYYLKLSTILNQIYLVGKVLEEDRFGITYVGWDLTKKQKLIITEYFPTGYVTRDTKNETDIVVVGEEKQEIYETGCSVFVKEANGLRRFANLPGIVSVKDCFQENKTAYIVTEFIEGKTLTEVLEKNDGKLNVATIMGMMEPIVQSLATVHRSGIIHYNIKPENIIVKGNGVSKLIRFGAVGNYIAEKERSYSMLLEPGYASEEQYRIHGELGTWTDVYALCATIYRVITGIVPEEALQRMYQDQLKLPSELGIEFNLQKEKSLMKGLAVLGSDRYQTMDELHRGLYEGYDLEKEQQKVEEEEQDIEYDDIDEKKTPSLTKKKRLSRKLIPIITVGIVFAAVWSLGKEREDVNTTNSESSQSKNMMQTEESISKQEVQTSQQTEINVLMKDEYNFNSEKATKVFGSDIKREEILHIIFLDTLKEMPDEAWDVSENGNETIMAWTKENDDGYDLYIAGKNGIRANESCKGLFANYVNVEEIEFNDCFDTSNVVNMEGMFHGCKNLTKLDINKWNTSRVTNMANMFQECERLVSLNLNQWDTSKVTNTSWMFFGCVDLTGLSIGKLDTSKVTNMEGMFSNCKNINELEIGKLDTSKVTNMGFMFSGCTKLENLDVSGLDTSKVRNMEFMFSDCRSLKNLDVSKFDTSKVTNMAWMFYNCDKLTDLDISNFDMSKVEKEEFMLENVPVQ